MPSTERRFLTIEALKSPDQLERSCSATIRLAGQVGSWPQRGRTPQPRASEAQPWVKSAPVFGPEGTTHVSARMLHACEAYGYPVNVASTGRSSASNWTSISCPHRRRSRCLPTGPRKHRGRHEHYPRVVPARGHDHESVPRATPLAGSGGSWHRSSTHRDAEASATLCRPRSTSPPAREVPHDACLQAYP